MGNTVDGTSVTQAAAILIGSIVTYFMYLLTLGPVVDLFIYEVAGSFDLNPLAQGWMNDIMIFGIWFYYVLQIFIVMMIFWFFVFIWSKHRYDRQADEFDFYR